MSENEKVNGSVEEDHIPKAGDKLKIKDVEDIVLAVSKRQKNFPDEPVGMTMALVMLNIGDRYSPVECMEQEWTGLKKDVITGNPDDIPKCPNGHVLMQGPGLKLGWMTDD